MACKVARFVVPAVIVMEALRQLGGLTAFEPVGYSTSADVTGETHSPYGATLNIAEERARGSDR